VTYRFSYSDPTSRTNSDLMEMCLSGRSVRERNVLDSARCVGIDLSICACGTTRSRCRQPRRWRSGAHQLTAASRFHASLLEAFNGGQSGRPGYAKPLLYKQVKQAYSASSVKSPTFACPRRPFIRRGVQRRIPSEVPIPWGGPGPFDQPVVDSVIPRLRATRSVGDLPQAVDRVAPDLGSLSPGFRR